jgi:hypothetical protein
MTLGKLIPLGLLNEIYIEKDLENIIIYTSCTSKYSPSLAIIIDLEIETADGKAEKIVEDFERGLHSDFGDYEDGGITIEFFPNTRVYLYQKEDSYKLFFRSNDEDGYNFKVDIPGYMLNSIKQRQWEEASLENFTLTDPAKAGISIDELESPEKKPATEPSSEEYQSESLKLKEKYGKDWFKRVGEWTDEEKNNYIGEINSWRESLSAMAIKANVKYPTNRFD